MIRLNITDNLIPMEALLSILKESSDTEALYFLCHQAGCPVYTARDANNQFLLFHHPKKEECDLQLENGCLVSVFEDILIPFRPLPEYKKFDLTSHMLGSNPFEETFCIWDRVDGNNSNFDCF